MHTKPFANSLRFHRTNAGLRQTDVARLLGLDCADRLSRWENGLAVPSIVNLFKLATVYKVEPRELYGELYQSITNEQLRAFNNSQN
jgi:transcriptional regulator with XRE-family HTH domain